MIDIQPSTRADRCPPMAEANSISMNELIPIFPLELVVYPGEQLNLHIFEPRYKQLINDCAKTKAPFGIPTVLNQKIAGRGTLAQLTEIMNVQPDGQMDIRARGLKVFRIARLIKLYPGKLYGGAEVEYPADQTGGDLNLVALVLADLKKLHLILKLEKKFLGNETALTSYDLAHHAGLSLKQEYQLLELGEECQRLAYLKRHLEQVLPVVAEMESLKEKIKLNGHFKNLPGFEL